VRTKELSGALLTGVLIVAALAIPVRRFQESNHLRSAVDSLSTQLRGATLGAVPDWALVSLKDVPVPPQDARGHWRLVLVSGRECVPCAEREEELIAALSRVGATASPLELWLVGAAPRNITDFATLPSNVLVRQLKLANTESFRHRWTATVPTLFVVGPNNRVQEASVGFYPGLDRELFGPLGRISELLSSYDGKRE